MLSVISVLHGARSGIWMESQSLTLSRVTDSAQGGSNF